MAKPRTVRVMNPIGIGHEGVRRRADADAAQVHGDWTVGVAETKHFDSECVTFVEQRLNVGRAQILIRQAMKSVATANFDAPCLHASRASSGERVTREG
ncbi:hypothetical protein GCM10025858_05360 [Alicyclobacillus sacchari]|nr:hypothetical protein GCM10025858_05360 [Alicyclobacillus sacchari]